MRQLEILFTLTAIGFVQWYIISDAWFSEHLIGPNIIIFINFVTFIYGWKVGGEYSEKSYAKKIRGIVRW